ncbi:hypothetical protein SDC9_141105 [bioreactor metagenome]|uniref:Uncharacterized protein n=1 Tax=bioreactor metagenome TaxID=1076179 RepID=A0A645DZC6_9ZZZZ
MVGAIVQGGLYASYRIAGQYAFHHTVMQALFDMRNKVSRHSATDNLVDKDKIIILGIARFKGDPYVTELAAAAGLFLMTALGTGRFTDGFTVWHLHGFKVYADAKFLL